MLPFNFDATELRRNNPKDVGNIQHIPLPLQNDSGSSSLIESDGLSNHQCQRDSPSYVGLFVHAVFHFIGSLARPAPQVGEVDMMKAREKFARPMSINK